jgi:hypothetical protein
MATTTTTIRYITRRDLDKSISHASIHSSTTAGTIRGALLLRQSIPDLKHTGTVGWEHAVLHTVEIAAVDWRDEAAGDEAQDDAG